MDLFKKGYLLVELMISLAVLTLTATMIGTLASHIAYHHTCADFYIKATTTALSIFQIGSYRDSIIDNTLDVSIEYKKLDTTTPYQKIIITIASKHKTIKPLIFTGGLRIAHV